MSVPYKWIVFTFVVLLTAVPPTALAPEVRTSFPAGSFSWL
jgi:hypothetical protein